MTRVVLRFETEPVTLRIVRKQAATAAAALGASQVETRRIELAVDEALVNAYIHAYEGGLGPVEMEIAYDGSRFAITIHDEGKGPPWRTISPGPLDPETGKSYGL